MKYTIHIDNSSDQAKSILNLLFTLSKDYDFLKISNEGENSEAYNLSSEQVAELDRRLEYVLQNPLEGKTWDEVEQKFLNR